MADAEAVLLVYHEQSQILENHRVRKHGVRAYEHVDFARGKLRLYLVGLGLGTEAREHFDDYRVSPEPPAEIHKVLLAQNRRGAEDSRLLAAHGALENRPHRDFRLAEAHVRAQQPVHRLFRLHVRLDLRGGAQLVGGFGVFEGVLKVPLPFVVLRKGEPLCDFAPRLHFQQFGGVVERGELGGGLDFRPRL